MSQPTPNPERQARIEAALAEYLRAADAGVRPNPDAFLARFADLRPELDDIIAAEAALAGLAAPLRPEPESTAAFERTSNRTPQASAANDASQSTRVRYFGDYELRNELGRGGMGVVYRARQVSLNRPVALKMLKAGLLADADELRRFKNEAEAVALLDHPGIVPVYEVGEHDGQRYFSMKLVEGGSLVPLLPRYKDDPRAAARLVAEAAEAVAHAHMRGILHRDLKPANLLVDDAGHPHVTDFGLAKRIEADTEQTASGAILGTPAYMSPEQANGRRGSITTATDVYGLGAILYALLTGKAPFGGDSVVDTLEAVRERMPEPPSKRNARAPRDLETICLKCLDKDPRRRYSTAQALADDLHAWLDNRPIAARPVGTAERVWLWCKRKPVIAVLSMATLGLLAATTLFAIDWGRQQGELARKQAQLADQRAKANQELAAQFEATKKAEAEANRWLDQAMAAIKDYYSGFGEEALRGEQVPEAIRERLLARPREFYEALTTELAAQANPSPREQALLAEGRFSLSRILHDLGHFDEARQQGEAAIALLVSLNTAQPRLPEHQYRLAYAYSNLGDILGHLSAGSEAQEALQKAIARFEDLVAAQPGVPEYLNRLAGSYNNLSAILRDQGEHQAARRALERAATLRESLVAAQPTDPDFQNALAHTYTNLGVILRDIGEGPVARQTYEKAITRFEALVAAHPGVLEFRHGLARSYDGLGALLAQMGEAAAAREAFEKAIAMLGTLAAAQPGVLAYQDHLADSYNNLGLVLGAAGQAGPARVAYEKAIARHGALAAAHHGVPGYQNRLARDYHNLGALLAQTGEVAAAREAFEKATGFHEDLAAAHPGVPEYQERLASEYLSLGAILAVTSDASEARSASEKAIAWFKAQAAAHPDMPVYQENLAKAYCILGDALRETGEVAAAREAFGRAVSIAEKLAREHPESPDFASILGATLNNAAIDDLHGDRFAEGRSKALQAIAWQKKALAAKSDHPTYREFLKNHLTVLIGAAEGLGNQGAAAEAAREQVELRRTDPVVRQLDARQAAAIEGQRREDNAEWLRLAYRAYETGAHTAAARLFGMLLESEPNLADDRRTQHRYNAACAAVLAGTGQGEDDPPLDEAAKAVFRERARGWLEAELVIWDKLLASAGKPNPPARLIGTPDREQMTKTLEWWTKDPDLAGVRGVAIDDLPEPERAGWRVLWTNVHALRARAAAPIAELPANPFAR